MSEFKGTPGPWIFDEDDGDGGQVVVADNGDVVCVVGSYMTSVEEDFSNGPLLAAAPELLEALQELVHADCHSVRNSTVQINALRKAHNIITKALGQ
ncbi:hypothetical protein [Pantoea agglomerans]